VLSLKLKEAVQMMGFRVMNEEAVDQADEEDTCTYGVSDDELEAVSSRGLLVPTMVSSFGGPFLCC
jgi:hypothetical protein